MQDSANSHVVSREPLAASSGHAVSGFGAAGFVAALGLESADSGELRSVERCTEATCGQRTADASLLRIFHGLLGPDPPDRLELGQCSWAVLHTSAARFSMKPAVSTSLHDAAMSFFMCRQTEEERIKMQSWVDAFLKLYPCGECRAHMAPYVKDHPIQAQDSGRLSEWLCKAHNYVNADLGKFFIFAEIRLLKLFVLLQICMIIGAFAAFLDKQQREQLARKACPCTLCQCAYQGEMMHCLNAGLCFGRWKRVGDLLHTSDFTGPKGLVRQKRVSPNKLTNV